jgi:hypothetical protein
VRVHDSLVSSVLVSVSDLELNEFLACVTAKATPTTLVSNGYGLQV